MPSAPLGQLVRAEIDRRSRSNGADAHAAPVRDEVLKEVGISEPTFYGWCSGAQPTAQFDTADRVLTRLEALWFDVFDPDRWPDLYPAAEWPVVVARAARAWEG